MAKKEEAPVHTLEMKHINEDDLVVQISWCKVVEVEDRDKNKMIVENLDTGNQYYIQGENLISSLKSADFVAKTRKTTKTEIADTLVNQSFNTPITIEFRKKFLDYS